MDVDVLLNPWIITIIIIAFVIGNLVSMKYLGQSHLVHKNPRAKSDLDKLTEIYKQKDKNEGKQSSNSKEKTDSSKTKD